jgi:hypothetical protein
VLGFLPTSCGRGVLLDFCRFQKAVAEKLAPIEVDPNDKSLKAFFTRARNAALRGMTHDIHADIAHDDELTQVGTTAPPPPNTQHRMHVYCTYPLCYHTCAKLLTPLAGSRTTCSCAAAAGALGVAGSFVTVPAIPAHGSMHVVQKGGKQSIFPCVPNVASRQLALVTAVQNSCVLAQA